jgi:hypothetical protein
MLGLKNYLKAMMADANGCPSSKRLILILCTVLITVGYLANLFWGYTVEEFMFNAIMFVIIGGMGITGVEKFASKNPTEGNN